MRNNLPHTTQAVEDLDLHEFKKQLDWHYSIAGSDRDYLESSQ